MRGVVIKHPDNMRLAVAEMLKSVEEDRLDGKVSPKVGAVLFNPSDESLVTAHRGELRSGDHAEFTLIERKCRDRNLTGAIIYATLEPCAPGARKHPKLSCAERIVNARIRTVYIGIEDPDPTVARKGIEYLRQNRIEVQMFPPELQTEITEANKDFLNQALERAHEAEMLPPQEIILSDLERTVAGSGIDAFDSDLLARFRSSYPVTLNEAEFRQKLKDIGILGYVDGRFYATGFGLLLFGKNAAEIYPQSVVKILYTGEQGQTPTTFEGPLVQVSIELDAWLLRTYPEAMDRSQGLERQDLNKRFRELVREGVINALVHRDYDIEGAKIQLDAFPDRIVIQSPGLPIEPITLEQLQKFEAPTLSRNPLIHRVFSRLKLAEEQRLGMRTLEQFLPKPKFSWNDPYLKLEISKPSTVGNEELTSGEQKALYWLQKGGGSSTEYAKYGQIDPKTARERLSSLAEKGLATRSGKARGTRYEPI